MCIDLNKVVFSHSDFWYKNDSDPVLVATDEDFNGKDFISNIVTLVDKILSAHHKCCFGDKNLFIGRMNQKKENKTEKPAKYNKTTFVNEC